MYPRLKELRDEKGYTLAKMGKLLNISYQAYSNYENGRREPSIAMLEKLSDIFGVSIDYIVGNNDERDAFSNHKYLNFLLENLSNFNSIIEDYNKHYKTLKNNEDKIAYENEYLSKINDYKNSINDYMHLLIKINEDNVLVNGYDEKKKTFVGVQWAKHYLETENFFNDTKTAYNILTSNQLIEIANQLKFKNDNKKPAE